MIELPQIIDSSECLTVPGFTLTRTGLIVDGAPTYEQYLSVGRLLGLMEASVHFSIGDWLNSVERDHGEKYDDAIKITGYDYQTCANDKYVAGKVDFSRRREKLPFSHHAEVASLDAADQDKILSDAEREGWSQKELRQQVRLRKEGKPILPMPLVDGCTIEDLQQAVAKGYRFGTIYADPPWQYGNQATRASTDNHYSTMTVDEIAALPVKELAADNAHLHLWTTNGFIFECPRIMEAWGFEYKSMFVWCKPTIGLGNYWRVATEIMLLGVRGSQPFRDHSLINWAQIEAGEHSAKPEQVRRLIEKASPGPYLELFARQAVQGWVCWGNEVSRDLYTQHLEAI